MIIVAPLIAFASGAVAEALAVLWVHFAERNQRVRVFAIGVLMGIATVLGIGEALHTLPSAVGFVLGYGCGPLIGIELKRRLP